MSTLLRLVEKGKISKYQPGGKGHRVLYRRDELERACKANTSVSVEEATGTHTTEAESISAGETQDVTRGPKPPWMKKRST